MTDLGTRFMVPGARVFVLDDRGGYIKGVFGEFVSDDQARVAGIAGAVPVSRIRPAEYREWFAWKPAGRIAIAQTDSLANVASFTDRVRVEKRT